MIAISAIATTYAGVHFKSRLESRFAEYLNERAVQWAYEPQSNIFRSYQPDFYLPRVGAKGLYVEIKPLKYLEELNLFWKSEIWSAEAPWICVDKQGRSEWVMLAGNMRFDGGLCYSPYPTPITFGVGLQILADEVRFLSK